MHAVPELTVHPILQSWRWIRAPTSLLDECARRFGDVFSVRILGFGRVTILSDPDAIKEVFAGDPDILHAGKAAVVLRPFLGQHSVIVLDGKEHQRQRQLLMPPFHGERMRAYGQTMVDLSHAAVARWPIGRPFRLHPRMQEITLQVILRTVFGMEEGALFSRLAGLLRDGLEQVASPLLLIPFLQRDLGRLSPWGRFMRIGAQVDEILLGEMRRRRAQNVKGSDILSLLLDARDEEGRPMTDQELRDELITLLVAGHETTATALCWTLRHVLADAALLRRLREEIAGEAGDLAPEKIARLELLDATVREALRLQPVVPMVGRVLQAPLRLSSLGLDLPAGAIVAASIYLTHRRPDLYPDPARFDPERFLRRKPAPSEWLPFGGGARRCIGAAFAMHEMKMVLAVVLARTALRLHGAGQRAREVRRSITLTPEGGLPVVMDRLL